MSSNLRFTQFASASSNKKNLILSAQQQPQQQTPAVTVRQRKSATPTNIPKPTIVRPAEQKPQQEVIKTTNFSDTDDDEQDYFEDESDGNLSKEERYVLLQPRAEPQGQENLSGNVTPVNDNQQLNIFEKATSQPQPPPKVRYSSASTDATPPAPQRFSNRSVSVDMRDTSNPAQRNSLILQQQQQQQQQQHSNRNSIDHSQSNRSSLDVSQSSYSTLIIHDNNESQPLFSGTNPGFKHDLYFINSSPSPPNYKKDKSTSRSLGTYAGHTTEGTTMTPITENEQQYLNQSYVLKHLAKEVKIPTTLDSSTRDSGVSENNSSSNQQNWPDMNTSRSKSKSQPDLTKLNGDAESRESNNSATNTLNFNDFEQLEVENNKLRVQLNDCLMKVAKSQKLEQEVSNIYRVHEELVQSCERRERLEKTARTRLQTDCRRLQELNRALREQVETLQQQLLIATTQQQQQLSSSGRTQQDLLITQLIQQNKELVDANKRQYIEIQAQSATLEEQRIHINVLDSALKRLEEEVRQKQLYQKQLQSLIGANESARRDKIRLELENELSKDLNRTPTQWQLREKDNQIMRMEAECSKFDQRNLDDARNLGMDGAVQDTDRIISEAHSAQRKVNELQTRLKLVENRLAEKEKEDILRQLQEQQKLYSTNQAYNILNNNDYTPSSSSIVSSAPTTPLIYNATNYDNLMPSSNSSKTVSATSNSSFDAILAGAYSGLYQQNYVPKLSSVPPTSSGISPNTSCSSTSNTMQHKHQEPSITSSSSASNYLNYDQSLDEQRKTIDDQLKKLDNQLLTKICCFPSNLLSKKPVLAEEMTALTSSNNNSDAFLQNLAHLRNQRENTPANSSNSGKNEEIVLLEKQGRSSQKLRNNNLAQISSTIGQNMNDISNITSQPSETSKLPKLLLSQRKDRQSSAPPSNLPRVPRSLKQPRKIEYGRLSETESNKSNNKSEYEMKTSSLKRHQSPVTSSGSKNFVDIKTELQMALNSTKNNPKNYGTIKTDTTNNITKIYYSNKPDYLSTKNYQRLPDSPSSSDSQKRFVSNGKKITFMRQSPGNQHQQSREGSISSGSSPKPDVAYQQLTQRSRTRTPPKYLNLNPNSATSKMNYLSSSNNSSPTKPTLPSSSVLHHAFQAQSQNQDWKQHQRANSGRSNSGENKYRIQF